MATDFPGSVQTFTAPAATDSMLDGGSNPHHTLHDTLGDTLEAVQSFVHGDIATHELTAVSTSSQTRTIDLANGPIQKITADQDFAIAATVSSARRGIMHLYVYANGGEVNLSDGTNTAGMGETASDGNTMILQILFDGTRAVMLRQTTFSSVDLRPT